MTRADLIRKWCVYALGLLPIWLLDAYILPRYPIFGVTPMLLPTAVAVVAVLEGSRSGAGFGLGVGLLWALTYPSSPSYLVFAMALSGMLIGVLAQYALRQSTMGAIFCSFCLLSLVNGLRVAAGRFTNAAPLSTLLAVAVPQVVLSLLWSPLVWFIFRAVFDRVGGEKLA